MLVPCHLSLFAVEKWRKEKLQEVKLLARETEGLTSSILKEEAGMLLSLEGCGLVSFKSLM